MITYRHKLIIILSLLVAVSQLITGFIISKQSEQALDEKLHNMAQILTRNISSMTTKALVSRDLATLYEQVRWAMQQKNVRFIKIVDLENKILMSETLSEVGSTYDSPAFNMKKFEQQEETHTHYKSDQQETVANFIEPVILGQETLGYVILGYSHAEITTAIAALQKKTLKTLLLGLIGAFIITVLIASMITKPLLKLEKTASRIAAGKFDLVKPEGKGHDEFNLLAQTIYTMAKRLESLVYNDPLTGIYNRLLLNIRLREELARSRRHKWPLAMLIADIDHFKNINDTYGHLVGDEMLVACSQILCKHIREEDCLARFGGEEFVILAPDMTEEHALQLAERIRSAIHNEHFISTSSNKPIRMTISIGLAIYPDHAKDENELISTADKALYEAKYQGRNKVILST